MPPYGAADFNTVLKKLMVAYGTTEGGKQDAITNTQREIDNVKGIMTENIERVLERGERIDLLVDKTDRLGVGAHDFRVRSRGLKRRMWWKNVKLMALLGVVVVFLIYLFVGFGCGLPGKLICCDFGNELDGAMLTLHRVVEMRGIEEGLMTSNLVASAGISRHCKGWQQWAFGVTLKQESHSQGTFSTCWRWESRHSQIHHHCISE